MGFVRYRQVLKSADLRGDELAQLLGAVVLGVNRPANYEQRENEKRTRCFQNPHTAIGGSDKPTGCSSERFSYCSV
jgi:hypothetical protein